MGAHLVLPQSKSRSLAVSLTVLPAVRGLLGPVTRGFLPVDSSSSRVFCDSRILRFFNLVTPIWLSSSSAAGAAAGHDDEPFLPSSHHPLLLQGSAGPALTDSRVLGTGRF
jgi:hypothetical protein